MDRRQAAAMPAMPATSAHLIEREG